MKTWQIQWEEKEGVWERTANLIVFMSANHALGYCQGYRDALEKIRPSSRLCLRLAWRVLPSNHPEAQ